MRPTPKRGTILDPSPPRGERETDGRWIAGITQIPGAMAYGATREEAMARAEIVALRAIADRIEHGEARPLDISISLAAA